MFSISSWIPTLGLFSLIISVQSLGLSPQEREWLLGFHRRLRSSVKPPAANMIYLEYSIELEKAATQLLAKANGIPEDIPDSDERNYNFAMSRNDTATVSELAMAWSHQKEHLDAEGGGNCSFCGEYKKIIWASNHEFGCAKKQNKWTFLVCLYSPGGDWTKSSPYVEGESCSACSPNAACTMNQCDLGTASRRRLSPTFCGFMAAIFYSFFE